MFLIFSFVLNNRPIVSRSKSEPQVSYRLVSFIIKKRVICTPRKLKRFRWYLGGRGGADRNFVHNAWIRSGSRMDLKKN